VTRIVSEDPRPREARSGAEPDSREGLVFWAYLWVPILAWWSIDGFEVFLFRIIALAVSTGCVALGVAAFAGVELQRWWARLMVGAWCSVWGVLGIIAWFFHEFVLA